jgi:polar amino acid transport system substrate-binding protein
MPVELDRRTFYEKELELRMSTSYGPGRYDRTYEERGHDYPLPYVRWTENRNLQAFLQLVASGGVRPEKLGPETIPFADAVRVYEDLARGQHKPLALLFEYAHDADPDRRLRVEAQPARAPRDALGVAFIGAGNYAKAVLLPALASLPEARRVSLVTATGPSARRSAERFGYARCGTDPELVFDDPDVDVVFVATRHDSHADLAVRALRAGKAVWLEKPVGLDLGQVERVADAVVQTGGFLTVGYNRRFSCHARALRALFERRLGPMSIRYAVAAGMPPRGSWLSDPAESGGRVIGEVCHFVDMCHYLVGSPATTVYARALARDPRVDDSLVALLGFSDGSSAVIEYLAHTSRKLPKERFEVSADDRTAQCDNYRVTRIDPGEVVRSVGQDKGQFTAISEMLEAVRHGRPSPLTVFEIVAVSRATFAMLESAATGREIKIGV